jgi:hypothetical protein
MNRYHISPSLLLLVSVVMLFSAPDVHSQGSGCYFTAMNVYGPPSVEEGQKLEVHTLFSVTCFGGGYFTVRADLSDGRTGEILSTSKATYVILGPFAAVLTNTAVAPKAAGWWSLQMNLYVLDMSGVPVAPQCQQLFGLTIT